MSDPLFSIVTPSFNALHFLKRCAASIGDQGVSAEHIVVDGGSTDGTPDWLAGHNGLRWVSEKDRGMYDALNKGLHMARGEWLAYLNCDEQYLPGALAAVKQLARDNSRVDLMYGDMLVVDAEGALLGYRKSYPLRWPYVMASHLYVPSCVLFIHRRLVDQGLQFNPDYRDVGDMDFVVRALRNGARHRHVRRYLAAFAFTGSNMSAGANAQRECARMRSAAPVWVRAMREPLNGLRLLEKTASGAYVQSWPLRYELYTPDSPDRRVALSSPGTTSRWPG